MKIPKPTDDDKEYFQSLVPDDPRVEVKPMFGNLAGFVNGNMFMGLFGAEIGVKLDDADREKLSAEKGAGPFGPEERPMGGYVSLPASWRKTPAKSEPWVSKALEYVAGLPPKKPKKPKAKKN